MNIYKRFAKDTVIYGIASVLPRLVNILLVGLHTKVLLPESYSVNTKFYVLIAFFNVLFTYGMETAFFRYFTMLKEKFKVIGTAFTSLLVSGVLFTLVLYLTKEPLLQLMEVDERVYLIFIFILLLDTLMVIPYAYLRVTHRSVRFAAYRTFHVLVYAVFNLIFLLWFVRFFGQWENIMRWYNQFPKVYFIFIANLIASFSTFILFIPLLLRFKFHFDKKIWLHMLRYGLPIMVAGIFYIINENFDKIALDRLAGGEVMGAYAAIYKIGVFMILYITAFRLGAEPFYFNQVKEKNAPVQYANIMFLFVITGIVIMLGVLTFLNWIVAVFINRPEYLIALDIVPVILAAYLFLGIYFNLSIWYKLTNKTFYGTLFSMAGAVITIVFNIWFIPKIGFMASAWATFIAYGLMSLISYFLGRKHYPVPYQTFRLGFYTTAGILAGFWIHFQWYDNIPVKFLISLILISLILLLERRKISLIIQKIKT